MIQRARIRWRRWLRLGLQGIGLLTLFFLVWGFWWEPSMLIERDYTLRVPNWPRQCNGLRVDVVSDLHVGSPNNGIVKLDRLVDKLSASDSDVVLMAGDYVILSVLFGSYVEPKVVARHLKPLTARKRVYAVLGNHDWWKDGMLVRREFESAGIVILENRSTSVDVRDCRFWIAGIGDLWEGKPDIGRSLAAIPADAPILALTHNPDLFPDMPARVALTIAGHTHGGQVHLPLLGRPVVPSKLGDRYAIGEVVEGGRHLFVTPGIGTSILPVRFGVPPEISRLTIRRTPATP